MARLAFGPGWSPGEFEYQLGLLVQTVLRIIHYGLILTGLGCVIWLISKRTDQYNREQHERWLQSGAPEERKRLLDEWQRKNDELNSR